MLRQFSSTRILSTLLWDWLGSLGCLWLAAWLRTQIGILPDPLFQLLAAFDIPQGYTLGGLTPADILQPQVVVLVAVIWPIFLALFGVYDGRRNQSLGVELVNVLLAVCVATLTLAGLLYFTYRETPRLLFLLFAAIDLFLLLGVRAVLWANRFTFRRQARRRGLLVVGAGQVGRSVVEQLRKLAWANLSFVGFVDDDPTKQGQVLDGLPVLSDLHGIPAVLARGEVADAIVALPLRAHERLVETCQLLQNHGVRVHVIPDLFALSFPNATLDGFGGLPLIDLGRPGLDGRRRLWKRAFDVAAAALGLLVISPLLGLIALAIKLESPGPVLYRQQRIGENGRAFTMLKFRSMHADADPHVHREHVTRLIRQNLAADSGASLKLKNDARITRVGAFLRKTSFDELPQLLNVLRGEMSLVGPRPPIAYEVDLYQDWHKRRFAAPPGITGLWQVKGRNRVSFEEMVRMDIEYIERQSLWLDLQLLLQTPFAMIAGRGAG